MVTPSYVKKQSLWLKGKMLHGNLEQNCQQAMVEGADPASLFNSLTSAPELQHPPGEAKLVPAKPLATTSRETRTHGQDVSQEAASAAMGECHLRQHPREQPGCSFASPKHASAWGGWSWGGPAVVPAE